MKLVGSCLVVPMGTLGAVLFGPFRLGTVVRSIVCFPPSANTTGTLAVQAFSRSDGAGFSATPVAAPPSARALFAEDLQLDSSIGTSPLGVSFGQHPVELPLNVVMMRERFLEVQIGDLSSGGWMTVCVFADSPPTEV